MRKALTAIRNHVHKRVDFTWLHVSKEVRHAQVELVGGSVHCSLICTTEVKDAGKELKHVLGVAAETCGKHQTASVEGLACSWHNRWIFCGCLTKGKRAAKREG